MLFHCVGLLASLIFCTHVLAIQLQVHGERKVLSRRITRRTPVTSSELNNTADVSYFVDLELGGRQLQLLLDTGRCAGYETADMIYHDHFLSNV